MTTATFGSAAGTPAVLPRRRVNPRPPGSRTSSRTRSQTSCAGTPCLWAWLETKLRSAARTASTFSGVQAEASPGLVTSSPGSPPRRSRARRIIAVPRPPPPVPDRDRRPGTRTVREDCTTPRGRRRVGRGRVDDAGLRPRHGLGRRGGGSGGIFPSLCFPVGAAAGGASVTRASPPVQERCHEPDARRRDGLPRCVRRARPFSSLASSPQRPGWGRRIAPRGALPRSAPRLGSPGAAATLDGSRRPNHRPKAMDRTRALTSPGSLIRRRDPTRLTGLGPMPTTVTTRRLASSSGRRERDGEEDPGYTY